MPGSQISQKSALYSMLADMVRSGATNQAMIAKAKSLGVDEQTALRMILELRRRPPEPTNKRTEKIKSLARTNKAGKQFMIYGVALCMAGVIMLGFLANIRREEYSVFPFITFGLFAGGIGMMIVGFFWWGQAEKK